MPARDPAPLLARAARALAAGEPVLVYDDDLREREVDLFFDSRRITPEDVRRLRAEAGGLLFLALPSDVASSLQLPYLEQVYDAAAGAFPVLEALRGPVPYDARGSFSITVNHRGSYTGITDNERARTIRRFADLASLSRRDAAEARAALGREFRSPGHVHLCVAAEGLLEERRGHTELAVALAQTVGAGPVLAGAEMLDVGTALPLARARAYAESRGTVLLEGQDIRSAWRTLKVPG